MNARVTLPGHFLLDWEGVPVLKQRIINPVTPSDLIPEDEAPPVAPEQAHIELALDITPGTVVRVTISAVPGKTPQVNVTRIEPDIQAVLPPAALVQPVIKPRWQRRIPWAAAWSFRLRERLHLSPARVLGRVHLSPTWLLGLVFGLYILTRFIGLGSFPSYFSCDESISSVRAADLIQNGFRGADNVLLPTFLRNDGQNSLSATVYLQMLPNILLGQSVWGVRGFTALLSVLGAWWLYCILRDFFKLRLPWLGVLLLAAAPTWLLHSRTGLEAPQMVVFYIGFLYYYMRYRGGETKMLFASLGLGVLAFYVYTPGQLIVTASGVLLLMMDARYHWKNRKIALIGLGLLVLAALPLLRFWLQYPTTYMERLALYRSPLVDAGLTTGEKISAYFGNYLTGIDPAFWFLPNERENIKYLMGPYPNLPLVYFPLMCWGLWLSLRRWREAPMRITWVALLTAPVASALVAPSIPRMLSFILPVILLSALAIEWILDWLVKHLPQISRRVMEAALLLVLAIASIALLTDALQNGARWNRSYGLDGLQWGAPQVYAAAEDYVRIRPDRTLYISPNWTFQGDEVRRFFTSNPKIIVHGFEEYMDSVITDIDQITFVLTPREYDLAVESGKFDPLTVDQMLMYPDETPGFYFVRLRYAPNILEIFQAEVEALRALVDAEWMIGVLPVSGRTSQLDVGPVANAFDGDQSTLIRSAGSNPLVIEIDFDEVQELSGVRARLGSEAVELRAMVTPPQGEARTFSIQQGGSDGFKDVELNFGEPILASMLRIEILDVNSAEPANVHLWEVTLY